MPIVCTGNDFSTLYAPLIRDGRMEKYYWNPTREDRVGVCMVSAVRGKAAAALAPCSTPPLAGPADRLACGGGMAAARAQSSGPLRMPAYPPSRRPPSRCAPAACHRRASSSTTT